MNTSASETQTSPTVRTHLTEELHLDQKYDIPLYKIFTPLAENIT